MKFDFNGQDEIIIGFKNNQPIKLRANGQGVFKNENGGLSIDIDDDKLQGIKLIGQERPQMPNNVGLDGRAIPKAPMINETAQKERSILDDIAGFGSDLKRTAKAVWDDSIFGTYGTNSNKAEHIKTDIAKAQNNQGLISSLLSSDEAKKENALKLQSDYDKIARANGYDLGAVVENDKIYFGKMGDDGKIYTLDATPSIRNQIGANKGEIIGGLAGGAIGALTRNPGYGRAVVSALSSAGGSALGSGIDYKHKAQVLGDEVDTAGLLKRMGEGAVDDLAAAGALAATLKLGKPSLKLGGKILDNSLIATGFRQIANDNMGGAQKQLSQTLGGDEAVQRALNSAKNALDEDAYKNFVNADETYKIPQTPFNTLNKGVDFLNDNVIAPIEKGVKRVLQGENISEKEADMLLSALGDENGAKIILNSVANDPQAFSVAMQKLLKLNSSQKAGLDNAFKDSINAIESIKNFDTQVKGDFDEVIKTLDSEFSTAGIDLSALNADVKNALKNVLSDNGEISKRINNAIDSGGLKGLQDARAFINLTKSKIANADDAISFQRSLELDNAKGVIDNAVDEALNQFEKINPKIGESARELLNTARSDYKSLKEVTNSDLYKRMTGSMKDTNDLTNALIKSVDNQSGLNLDEILSRMPQANREQIENSLFKNIIDSFTNEGITDFKGAIDTLNKMPFRTQKALNAVEQLNANAGLLNNSGEILTRLKKMSPKQYELSQGIGKKVVGRAEVMVANRLMDKIKSRIPYYGNNRALLNHIANALKNSGDLNALIKNLDDIPPQSTDTLTRKQLEIFKNEIVPEIRQIVKETTEQEQKKHKTP
ncbi:hypothetical protein [Campylobacter gastrosuis]|uniref:Uncharacterized protein n=1 Tax=Campylobacter gastrosuis TaxID=2974576 RepID=A0ABT7HT38_9BACT|nr:hypothetical protein [Campylobacter gastrosuis]MDL0090036.1 hypothetical protein [Campylobacter gastrosuis]